MKAIKETFLEEGKVALSVMKNKLDILGSFDIKNINPKKTIAFNIDVNNGFAKEGALSSQRTRNLITDTSTLLSHLSKLGMQVVAITDEHTEESLEIKRQCYPMHCKKSSSESKVVDEIASIPNILIHGKNSTNAFVAFNPLNFEEMNYNVITKEELDEVDTYIFSGVLSDVCLYQAVMWLLTYLNQHNRKGHIIVPLNLIDTYDGPTHNADLMNLVFINSMMDNGINVVKGIDFEE